MAFFEQLEALQTLRKLGLVEKKDSSWIPTQNDIHLNKDSVLTTMNHSNWRNRALLDANQKASSGLHYTAVHSLSRSDFEKIKEIVLSFLDKTRSVVKTSAEEELYALTLDWFKV